MIKVGKVYKPIRARHLNHGELIRFDVPEFYKAADGKTAYAGVVQVMCYGDYDYKKGDSIQIDEITGVQVHEYEGERHTTIFAKATLCEYEVDAEPIYDFEEMI